MTLPAAFATIRMSDINVELGRSSTAQISLNAAEDGAYGAINTNSPSRPSSSDPASMSEWYSYDHNASGGFYYCETWWGECGIYQQPCWAIGLSECGAGGGPIQ
jgi:hypothetical protein